MTSAEPAGRAAETVGRLLAAVHARDPGAACACFAPGARYANVPHPPVIGPAGVRRLLAPILARSCQVVWELVSASYQADCAWVERVDRFWIDGREYSIECNAVVRVDRGTGLIEEFRDYVDLGLWRERLGGVLDR